MKSPVPTSHSADSPEACPARRVYRLRKRREEADRKRAAVLQAARQLLREKGLSGLAMEAVARQAGVTRQTVHNQFGSRAALLEAVCDSVALDGGLDRLPEAFGQADPVRALERFIAILVDFWAADEGLIPRLHGLGGLDPELAPVLEARHERRRRGLQVLVERLRPEQGGMDPPAAQEAVDTLFMLTSFESFASLARSGYRPEEIVRILIRLSRAVLGLKAAGGAA
jgi:AcrR family transcriptional regulator